MFESGDIEYGVLPFMRSENGDLTPLKPFDASNWASVQYRAEAAVLAGRYDGAVAFSRARDKRSGSIRTAIIAQFGELPDTLVAAVPEQPPTSRGAPAFREGRFSIRSSRQEMKNAFDSSDLMRKFATT